MYAIRSYYGWTWKTAEGELTLDFLVRDYYRHLEWHRELFERRVGEIRARRKNGSTFPG